MSKESRQTPVLVDASYQVGRLVGLVQLRWGMLRIGEMLSDEFGLDWLVAGVTTEDGIIVRSYLLAAGACWRGATNSELEGNAATVADDLSLCARLVITRIKRDDAASIRQVTLHLPQGQSVAYA